MTRVVLGARIALGLILLLAGMNGLVGFPSFRLDAPREALGYLATLRGTVEVLCAVALLRGRCVPLALALVLPALVSALAFHLLVDRAHSFGAASAVVLQVFLMYAYWPYYRSLLLVETPSRFAPTGSWRLTGNRPGPQQAPAAPPSEAPSAVAGKAPQPGRATAKKRTSPKKAA